METQIFHGTGYEALGLLTHMQNMGGPAQYGVLRQSVAQRVLEKWHEMKGKKDLQPLEDLLKKKRSFEISGEEKNALYRGFLSITDDIKDKDLPSLFRLCHLCGLEDSVRNHIAMREVGKFVEPEKKAPKKSRASKPEAPKSGVALKKKAR